ncbi:MAG: hypothetical protein VX899_17740 [Myxococcota bacterium]|nr:hypothetical protein [Myxococcota bacterium]
MRAELLEALRAGLEGRSGSLKHPWLGWLLLCLCRQRERQRWLMQVRKTHLVDIDEDHGEVPGLPDWSYQFHGVGLLLSGPGREHIDVDFHVGDPDGRTVDPYFFTRRVLALDPPELPERRLRAWLDSSALLVAGLQELREMGLIGHPKSRHLFELEASLGELWGELAASGSEGWDAAFGENGGDWVRAEFGRWSLSLVRRDRSRAQILGDLVGRVDPVALAACAREIYVGPVDAGTGRAIEALMALGEVPGEAELALAARLDPAQHNPFTACRLARWCLSAEVHTGLAVRFITDFAACRRSPGFRGNPFDDEYAFLALEFRPELAPALVAQALRSGTPSSTHRMGALLSLLQEPWCAEALLQAARESQEGSRTRYLVACLQHFEDPVVLAESISLMPAPPQFREGEVGYTGEQVAFLNLRGEVERSRRSVEAVFRRLRPQ